MGGFREQKRERQKKNPPQCCFKVCFAFPDNAGDLLYRCLCLLGVSVHIRFDGTLRWHVFYIFFPSVAYQSRQKPRAASTDKFWQLPFKKPQFLSGQRIFFIRNIGWLHWINELPSSWVPMRMPANPLSCCFKMNIADKSVKMVHKTDEESLIHRCTCIKEPILCSVWRTQRRLPSALSILCTRIYRTSTDIHSRGVKAGRHQDIHSGNSIFLRAILPRWFDKASEWISCQTSSE